MTLDVARETRRFAGPDGTSLAFHVLGDPAARTVVCVPGGPGRASTYLEDLGGLARTHRLICLDAPGTGESHRPPDRSGYGVRTLVDVVEALRTELGLDRMTLLGHSAGAGVAEIYAATHPDRLDALVLVTPADLLHGSDRSDVDAIAERRSDEPWYAASRAALDAPDDDDPCTARRRTLAFRPFMYGAWTGRAQAHAAGADHEQDPDAEAGYWAGAEDALGDAEGLRARLAAFDVPALVIAGALDAVTGVDAATAVAAALPLGSLAVLGHCGHFPWVDRPEDFARVIEEFLQQVHKQNG